MYPSKHILFGFLFSVSLYLIAPSIGIDGMTIIFLSSFLIDVDHYLYYVFMKKNLNLFKAMRWFKIKHSSWLKLSREERNKHKGHFYLFHGIESLLFFFILGYFINPLFYYFIIGFTFHLFLDLMVLKRYQDRLDKLSVIHDFLKFRKLKFIDDN